MSIILYSLWYFRFTFENLLSLFGIFEINFFFTFYLIYLVFRHNLSLRVAIRWLLGSWLYSFLRINSLSTQFIWFVFLPFTTNFKYFEWPLSSRVSARKLSRSQMSCVQISIVYLGFFFLWLLLLLPLFQGVWVKVDGLKVLVVGVGASARPWGPDGGSLAEVCVQGFDVQVFIAWPFGS